MTKREDLRARYIAGWYERNLGELMATTTPDYMFDDPVELVPVTRDGIAGSMLRWDAHAQGLNEWVLEHEVRQDKDGILTNWHWWRLVGTDLCGAAVVKTSDQGVFLERIAYFERRDRTA